MLRLEREAEMENHDSFKSAVLIPGAQASITAALVALLAGVAATWLKAEQPFVIALAAFGLVSLASWQAYRGEWRSRLEALLDIEHPDAGIQQPLTNTNELRVSIISDNARAVDYLHLPGIEAEQLAVLARGIVAGRGLAVHEWTGNGRPFTRSAFEELRGQLIERGFVRWRGNTPQQGALPTKKGEALFRALASPTREPARQEGVFSR